jgi:serine/threonine protein kinase
MAVRNHPAEGTLAMRDACTVAGTLREDASGGLYRGVLQWDRAPVVIKVLLVGSPVPRAAERLRHEHEILRGLEGSWVLKPHGLDEQQGQLRLVLEGFDGEFLSTLYDQPLGISQFLDVALRLTAAVADLHRQGVVHGDLKPENVLYQPRTGALKLLGFGIASQPSQVPAAPSDALLVEGSPAYMSPERTGHVSRGVDQRSDLHSLGVIFHEPLTGSMSR